MQAHRLVEKSMAAAQFWFALNRIRIATKGIARRRIRSDRNGDGKAGLRKVAQSPASARHSRICTAPNPHSPDLISADPQGSGTAWRGYETALKRLDLLRH
jgi:hypothetical protein